MQQLAKDYNTVFLVYSLAQFNMNVDEVWAWIVIEDNIIQQKLPIKNPITHKEFKTFSDVLTKFPYCFPKRGTLPMCLEMSEDMCRVHNRRWLPICE